MVNVEADCESCGKVVILTGSYKGQPIICLSCEVSGNSSHK